MIFMRQNNSTCQTGGHPLVVGSLHSHDRESPARKQPTVDAQLSLRSSFQNGDPYTKLQVAGSFFAGSDFFSLRMDADPVRLRTLACFFPKFSYDDDANENTSAASTAQSTMREALESGNYQVRISPKHSGSLALWNIEKDFFQAKNSAANLFTVTSQIVLSRVIASSCPGDTLQAKLAAAQQKIQLIKRECSGLCVGMEVVTRGLTGEHGDTPHVNYAVVTSICRAYTNGPGRFFGASEVIEFCCRYGLLWNEAFILTSAAAFQQFCAVHASNLVHGTDSVVIPLLRQLANVHIVAVPHAELQGELLEGVVVRLEPREATTCDALAARSAQQFSLDALRDFSRDLDDIWSQCGQNEELFLSRMKPEVDSLWGSGQITRLSKVDTDAILASILRMQPAAGSQVAESSAADEETAGIQGLVALMMREKLYSQHVRFKGLQLPDGSVCFIVHVLLDKVFATFNRTAPSGSFPLYRGYSFIVEKSSTVQSIRISHMHDPPASLSVPSAPSAQLSCMFKAKFMPYMIRTFIMRNCGLRLCDSISRGNGSAAAEYKTSVTRYIKSWVPPGPMLSEAFGKYFMYLIAWGTFLQAGIRSGKINPNAFDRGGSYLSLVAQFDEEMKQRGGSSEGAGVADMDDPLSGSPSNGCVVFITYPGKVPPECENAFHKLLQAHMGPSAVTCDATAVNDCEMLQTPGRLKALVKGGSVILVLVDLVSSSLIRGIEASIASVQHVTWWVYSGIPGVAHPFDGLPSGLMKKARALSQKWINFLSAAILPDQKVVPPQLAGLNISMDAGFDFLFPSAATDLRSLLDPMHAAPVYSPDRESKVCVVMFPAIPGSGKSTLASSRVTKALEASTGFKVDRFDGDDAALKVKFWSKLWDHINALPLYDGKYLIIASKNAPPSSREGGGNFYRELSNGCPAGVAFVAALPDDDGMDTHPFSLQYLALCMSRVVRRTARDHNTLFGLDAWKISVMFYNFYKDISRERLLRDVGALTDRVIQLPVISKSAPPMPPALEQLLRSCISSEDVPTDAVLAAFREHDCYIASLAPPIEECAIAFIDRIEAVLGSLTSSVSDGSSDFEYLAAFVDAEAFGGLISMLGLSYVNVDRAHVTLWHSRNHSPLFPVVFELMGQSVSVTVGTSCYRVPVCLPSPFAQVDAIFSTLDSKQIALRVSSMFLAGGDEVPVVNVWPHITVACEQVALGPVLCMFARLVVVSCQAAGACMGIKQASSNARTWNCCHLSHYPSRYADVRDQRCQQGWPLKVQ